jgi:hypothetical protein
VADKIRFDDVDHVMVHINTVGGIDEDVLYNTYIYESNSGLGLISSYSPATTIAIILSTQVELPASSPSHLVQLFNIVKLLSFNSGATFGIRCGACLGGSKTCKK